MKAALKKLLNTLDAVAKIHGELQDTEVCETLGDTLANGFIHPTSGYVVPTSFGMFTPAADALVHSAMSEFLSSARSATRLRSPKQRLDALQDISIVSAAGRTYRDYFGHVDDKLWLNYLAAKSRDEEFGFKSNDTNA